jgi:hypothetical protein
MGLPKQGFFLQSIHKSACFVQTDYLKATLCPHLSLKRLGIPIAAFTLQMERTLRTDRGNLTGREEDRTGALSFLIFWLTYFSIMSWLVDYFINLERF